MTYGIIDDSSFTTLWPGRDKLDRLRFAHISDLHFRSRTVDARGALPLLFGLERALIASGISNLVVSGDITDRGSAEEFALACTFLTGRLEFGLTHHNSAGLGGQIHKVVVVPGNHDHWAGSYWPFAPGYTEAVLGATFPKTPWADTWQSGRLRLQLFGLDSSSGNTGLHSFTPLQGGRVSKEELEDLKQRADALPVSTKDDFVVGALVLHHSLRYAGGLPRWHPPQAYAMHRQDMIKEFMRDWHVAALLTGHTHDAWVGPLQVDSPTQQEPLIEFRSATTLCGPPRSNVQGFLVHDITVDSPGCDKPVLWRAYRVEWNGIEFARSPKPCYTFRPRLRRSRPLLHR